MKRHVVDDKAKWSKILFAVWIGLGIGVVILMGISMSSLKDDEVLRLGTFVGTNATVRNYSYLAISDRVPFTLEYEIVSDTLQFQVLLLTSGQFQHWKNGQERIEPITRATTHARFRPTRVPNLDREVYRLVVQQCLVHEHDYCSGSLEPIQGGTNLYTATTDPVPITSGDTMLLLRRFAIIATPQSCATSGPYGYAYLIILLPWFLVVLFVLRHLLCGCVAMKQWLIGTFMTEAQVPEAEVDYWQPSPWDRKVPKTRLFGPCCWRKLRRPTEPFYTWWR